MSGRRRARALLAVALWALPSLAQDAQAEAKRLFEQGMAELAAGKNEEALADFLKSRELKPSRVNTQNAALTLKRLGRYDESLELLRRMPEEFPKMTATQREAVLAEIEELERSTGLIDVESSEAGATVIVAGRARGLVPLSEPVRVNPGQHLVRVERDGRVVARALIQVAAGGRVRAVPTAEVQPEKPPTVAQPKTPARRDTRSAAPPAAPETPWRLLRLGLSTGALVPVGTIRGTANLSEVGTTGIAAEVDAGYAALPSLELGGYFSYAELFPGSDCEAGPASSTVRCDVGVSRFGLMITYRTTPPGSTVIPYMGVGIGYDRISVGRQVENSSGAPASVTDEDYYRSSYGVRAQLGLDVALSRLLLLGPRGAASTGTYEDGAAHVWLDLGVRLSFQLIEH